MGLWLIHSSDQRFDPRLPGQPFPFSRPSRPTPLGQFRPTPTSSTLGSMVSGAATGAAWASRPGTHRGGQRNREFNSDHRPLRHATMSDIFIHPLTSNAANQHRPPLPTFASYLRPHQTNRDYLSSTSAGQTSQRDSVFTTETG
ncbi:hypothetical protein EYF80_040772 [Liparis tanakae]|uniref:Uncharacterized protein n=1 Tax=Liparis tanakae TaxID=230148 RepID=A0A4Z2G7A7_9TELE|nr:hypothetical protein EYF80_040772 [Liparis tanakae]